MASTPTLVHQGGDDGTDPRSSLLPFLPSPREGGDVEVRLETGPPPLRTSEEDPKESTLVRVPTTPTPRHGRRRRKGETQET